MMLRGVGGWEEGTVIVYGLDYSEWKKIRSERPWSSSMHLVMIVLVWTLRWRELVS